MAKPVPITDSIFDEIVEEAPDIRRNGLGDRSVHVAQHRLTSAALRGALGLTQAAFAARFGFGIRAGPAR